MSGAGHGALMDAVYRRQRFIYDATRKYFLLGRDELLDALAPERGDRVLEIGCGTGRNLILAARQWPEARFFGVDISSEMLRTARGKVEAAGLSERIRLAEGDATRFDPEALFGEAGFERVFLSYSLSMIPDWRGALERALDVTAPEGRLMVVDFGMQDGLPGWVRAGLSRFLALYHVEPQPGLPEALREAAAERGREARVASRYADWSRELEAGPVRPPWPAAARDADAASADG
ncbi:MAG: class I SAM-dependent methyltransferase [Paracoccaceae bacterium]